MSAPLIEVETEDFAAAARILRSWVAEPAGAAVTGLANELGSCRAMAGSDPGGQAWADEYDRAAASALKAAGDAVNAVDMVAAMFLQTARNYDAAEAASTPGAHRRMDAAVATVPCISPYALPYCVPPSARGGSAGPPHGWGLVEHLVGYVWPDGHQDRLRAAGAAWRRSAMALDEGACELGAATARPIADAIPEAGDISTVCSSLSGQLREIAGVHRTVGAACDDLAQHIDDVHGAVVGELESLLAWTAGIQAGGALLSSVTLGAAELPAQAVEAERAAATAARIARLIEKFIELARATARAVAGVVERADRLAAELTGLLDVRLTTALVTQLSTAPLTLRVQAAIRIGVEAGDLPPLTVPLAQVEDKFKHARVFGVLEPRGRAGFQAYETAVRRFIHDRRTQHLIGTYRGKQVILNYNVKSQLVVVQELDGTFVSGWRVRRTAMLHVIRDRSLGGG